MYLNNLQQDEIFVPSEMKSLESITGIQSRRGLENVIVSNGKVVNVVSNSYGHIPNELFFGKAEQLLVDVKLSYHKRSINRNDRSFVVDFIILDENQFLLKDEQDRFCPCSVSKTPMTVAKRLPGILVFTGRYVPTACTYRNRR